MNAPVRTVRPLPKAHLDRIIGVPYIAPQDHARVFRNYEGAGMEAPEEPTGEDNGGLYAWAIIASVLIVVAYVCAEWSLR